MEDTRITHGGSFKSRNHVKERRDDAVEKRNVLNGIGEAHICQLIIRTKVNCPNQSSTCELRVYLSQNGGVPSPNNLEIFRPDDSVSYEPFCDDFGPMNAGCIIRFIEQLEDTISRAPSDRPRNIVYCAETGPRPLTNAAFLLGAFMILKLNHTPSEVSKCFRGMDAALFEPFRDATFAKPTFGLELEDCWEGLGKGMQKGWLTAPTLDDPSVWGKIDKDAYMHYDNPFNADLHEVVPGKLVVLRGPKDMGGREFCDNFKKGAFIGRDFCPEYYVDILKALGVSTIVRLNVAQYNQQIFTCNGIRHHDLLCEDGSTSTPSTSAVSRFFKIMDETRGCVAIHGQSSFGRAGTLAALHLMRAHEFTARQAIAWVRMMRPGCIVGCQQHYLCNVEDTISQITSAAPAGLRRSSSSSNLPSSYSAFQGGSIVGGGLQVVEDDIPQITSAAPAGLRRASSSISLRSSYPVIQGGGAGGGLPVDEDDSDEHHDERSQQGRRSQALPAAAAGGDRAGAARGIPRRSSMGDFMNRSESAAPAAAAAAAGVSAAAATANRVTAARAQMLGRSNSVKDISYISVTYPLHGGQTHRTTPSRI